MGEQALRDQLQGRFSALVKEAGGLMDIALVADVKLFEQMKLIAASTLHLHGFDRSDNQYENDSKKNSDDGDLEDFIVTFLAHSDIPMSLEQVFQAVDAQDAYTLKRNALAVRLHRMATATRPKIVNTARGHYWLSEQQRVEFRKVM